MRKRLLISGSVLAFLAVMIGAFGAHALDDLLESNGLAEVFQTGVRYHMFHSLALLFLGVLAEKNPHKLLGVSGILFLVGIILFSGSLYVLAITSHTWIGIITPIGGLCFLTSWAILIYLFLKRY